MYTCVKTLMANTFSNVLKLPINIHFSRAAFFPNPLNNNNSTLILEKPMIQLYTFSRTYHLYALSSKIFLLTKNEPKLNYVI